LVVPFYALRCRCWAALMISIARLTVTATAWSCVPPAEIGQGRDHHGRGQVLLGRQEAHPVGRR